MRAIRLGFLLLLALAVPLRGAWGAVPPDLGEAAGSRFERVDLPADVASFADRGSSADVASSAERRSAADAASSADATAADATEANAAADATAADASNVAAADDAPCEHAAAHHDHDGGRSRCHACEACCAPSAPPASLPAIAAPAATGAAAFATPSTAVRSFVGDALRRPPRRC